MINKDLMMDIVENSWRLVYGFSFLGEKLKIYEPQLSSLQQVCRSYAFTNRVTFCRITPNLDNKFDISDAVNLS